MNENFGQIILSLRKSMNITQDELAKNLNISSQAISKWENGACLPDTQMLPLLANFFGVSIDYLFNGDVSMKDKDVREAAYEYIYSFGQFKGYRQAIELFNHIHAGLCNGGIEWATNTCTGGMSHISDDHGVSIADNRGCGILIERSFFSHISLETLRYAEPVFSALIDTEKSRIIMSLVAMDSASFGEIAEMTEFNPEKLRTVLDSLIASNIIDEKKSKHKSLGTTYQIKHRLYACICVILATAEVMRQSGKGGFSCYLSRGDYPVECTGDGSGGNV